MTKDEEIMQLKKELETVRKNTRANVETLDNMYGENVDLKKENKELQRENENLKKEIIRLRKTVVTQEMERNDLFKRFAKVEAELEDYRMQEFNHKMFKK